MKKSPTFKFNASQFLIGTANFKAEEVGAYIRLLCYQWENYSIEENDFELIAGLRKEKLERVIKKFKCCEDGLYRNQRLEKAREDKDPMDFIKNGEEEVKTEPTETSLSVEMQKVWYEKNELYPRSHDEDLKALTWISIFIKKQIQLDRSNGDPYFKSKVYPNEILDCWRIMAVNILNDKFWKDKSLTSLERAKQEIWQKSNKNGQRKQTQSNLNQRIEEMFAGK